MFGMVALDGAVAMWMSLLRNSDSLSLVVWGLALIVCARLVQRVGARTAADRSRIIVGAAPDGSRRPASDWLPTPTFASDTHSI